MVESFPDTICYGLFFQPGASGNFLKALILNFIYGPLPLKVSNLGDSHDEHYIYRNIKWNNSTVINPTVDFIEAISPIDKLRPIILHRHELPNYHQFFTKFPKGKIIIIYVTDDMKLRIISNYFLKYVLPNWSVEKNSYDLWIEKYPQFKNIKDPTKLSTQELSHIFLTLDLSKDHEFFNKIDRQDNENIIQLSYKDVIHNMDNTLYEISKITNMPIYNHTIKFYKNYLVKQAELIKTKMPWVTM